MTKPTEEQIEKGEKSFGFQYILADTQDEIIKFLMSDSGEKTGEDKISGADKPFIKGETEQEIIDSITRSTPLFNKDIPDGIYIDSYQKCLRGMQDNHKLIGLK